MSKIITYIIWTRALGKISSRQNQSSASLKLRKYTEVFTKTWNLATAASIIWKQKVGFMPERTSLKNIVLWNNKVLNKEVKLVIPFSKSIQPWSLDNTLNWDQCMRNFKYYAKARPTALDLQSYANIDRAEILHVLGPSHEDMTKLHC